MWLSARVLCSVGVVHVNVSKSARLQGVMSIGQKIYEISVKHIRSTSAQSVRGLHLPVLLLRGCKIQEKCEKAHGPDVSELLCHSRPSHGLLVCYLKTWSCKMIESTSMADYTRCLQCRFPSCLLVATSKWDALKWIYLRASSKSLEGLLHLFGHSPARRY